MTGYEETRKEVAQMIARRIGEMKETDEETGEHPDATEADYIEWAIEECQENEGLVVEIIHNEI